MSTDQINNFIHTNVSNILLNDEINIQNTLEFLLDIIQVLVEDEIHYQNFDRSDSNLSNASTVIF
jgi:hypothetical protein